MHSPRATAEALPPPAPGAVAVFGEALVDVFADGSRVAGGAPFNVARWLAAFGVPTLLVTRVGCDDAAADLLRAEMRRFGMDERGVQQDPVHATGVVHVRPDGAGHRFEIADNAAWDHIDAAPALPLLKASPPVAVCFGSLALRHAASAAAIATLAQATDALRLVDLNLRDVATPPGIRALAERALTLADWVKVNDEELRTVLAWFTDRPPPVPGSTAHADAVGALGRRFQVQRFIVTRGAAGWCVLNGDGRIEAEGDAQPVGVIVDTVGAGDAFTATLLTGVARGWPLPRSLAAANRLAGAVCSWQGALPADDARVAQWRTALGFDDMQVSGAFA